MVSEAQPGHVGFQVSSFAEGARPGHHRRADILFRGLGQQGAEARVREVVGQHGPAVAGSCVVEVTRPPAGDPGVEGDDDRLVAGGLGAATRLAASSGSFGV